jgi:hypothetical protein
MLLPIFTGNRPRPLKQLGVRGGRKGHRQATTLARGHPAIMVEGADGRAPLEDVFQSSDSAALPVGDQDVVVPEAKLSRLLFL